MHTFAACTFGVVCGLAACAPPGVLFELALQPKHAAKPDVALGLASIFASFVLLTVAIGLVHVVDKNLTLPFGCTAIGVFLIFWGIESIRGLRAAWHNQI